METSQLRDEKEVLDRQQHTDIEAQKNLEENLQQLESRKQELELQEEQMQARLKKIVDAVVKNKELLTRARKEQREMKDKLGNSRLVKLLQMVFVLLPIFSASGFCCSILVRQSTFVGLGFQ